MPRKRQPERISDNPMEPMLALPAPKPHKHHQHQEDAYESLPGAVPQVTTQPIKRRLTTAEKAERRQLRKQIAEEGKRYDQYLDLLAANGGKQEEALAIVFNLSQEEASLRKYELVAEVRKGIGTSSISDELEREDLGLKSQVKLLRSHAYSSTPAASLKAIDMIQELQGNRDQGGTFEQFLRLAKAQTR